VGDNKQMPPTSFFATQQVDDEDAEFDDLDSILDDCQALSLPDHYLAFHYRSKHESLIAFSNQEYYEGRLLTFPSADDRVSKVSLQQIEGVYDKGGKRSNRAEAEAVVREIIQRLSADDQPQRSIGVVSFSVAQQNLIEDLLMEEMAAHPELEAKAFQVEEPVFVKNLENVQGDERDVILFSVGYGPDADGNVSMNFGPLNNRGGERRLNVAVSRARYEMKVFSTLRAEQIDLRRSKAAGVEGLQKFLKYAERGLLEVSTTASSDASQSDALAENIAAAVRELGFEATTGVGRSKFKVDVAVVDPQDSKRYILGILIDSRRHAETKIARDRELTQPAVLQGLGWKVLRVWSVDWLQNRQRVMERIRQLLQSEESTTVADSQPLNLQTPEIVAEKSASTAKPATAAGASSDEKADIDDLPASTLDKTLLQVVNAQVALPVEDLLRAATRQLGYSRRTKRIDAALMKRIGALIVAGKILRDGERIKTL
jgi:very-short-patch-repair endonuclease